MIQFNLLPDVKQEFIKARRLKYMVVLISSVVAGASLAIFIIMLVIVDGVQKKSISDLTNTISSASSTIKNTPNINKILTVQNQLESLPTLHGQKPVASKLFGYVAQITPSSASISSLDLDFTANTIKINGGADSLATVNTFVDTLKYTTYSPTGKPISNPPNAFTGVVLTSFSYGSTTGINYVISANFAPAIFSESNSATLTVPNLITTRQELNQITPLFKSSTDSTNQTGAN